MNNKLYLAITADKYELPLFVSSSRKELAAKFGLYTGTIVNLYPCEEKGIDKITKTATTKY